MVLLGAVFLYGCRVQREEDVIPQIKSMSAIAQKAKMFYENRARKKSGTSSRFLYGTYEPDFANAIQKGTSECQVSLLTSLKKGQTNSRLLILINLNGKQQVGEPKLLMRSTKQGFNMAWVMTVSNKPEDINNNDYFNKSATFSGSDYFFDANNDALIGANHYGDGVFTHSQVLNYCYTSCQTFSDPDPPQGGNPTPPQGGGTNLVEQIAPSFSIDEIRKILCSYFKVGCPDGSGQAG